MVLDGVVIMIEMRRHVKSLKKSFMQNGFVLHVKEDRDMVHVDLGWRQQSGVGIDVEPSEIVHSGHSFEYKYYNINLRISLGRPIDLIRYFWPSGQVQAKHHNVGGKR